MADAIAEHLARYNREFNDSLTKEDLRGKRFWQVVPATASRGPRPVPPRRRLLRRPRRHARRTPRPRRAPAALRNLHRLCRYGSPQLLQPQVPLARAPLPLHPLHPHRLLRRQIHPPRRLPHRRQPPPARRFPAPASSTTRPTMSPSPATPASATGSKSNPSSSVTIIPAAHPSPSRLRRARISVLPRTRDTLESDKYPESPHRKRRRA